jgi:hypothetical protein
VVRWLQEHYDQYGVEVLTGHNSNGTSYYILYNSKAITEVAKCMQYKTKLPDGSDAPRPSATWMVDSTGGLVSNTCI